MKHEVPSRSLLPPPASSRGGAFLRNLGLAVACAAVVLVGTLPAPAQVLVGHEGGQGRNFDARLSNKAAAAVQRGPSATQQAALDRLSAEIPSLAVTYDPGTGVTRSLYNRTGLLTGPQAGDPFDIAIDFVRQNTELLGLTPDDLEGFEVTDVVPSSPSGVTHIYLRQTALGIPVYNGQLHVNVTADGEILSVNNAFVPGLGGRALAGQPGLGAEIAVSRAAQALGVGRGARPETLGEPRGPQQKISVGHAGISREPIEAQLMWLPQLDGEVTLVWNFQIAGIDDDFWKDLTVDATTGEVLTSFDWTTDATFRVYPQPVESPIHTTPLPPSDARSLVVNPEEAVASPNGWMTTGSSLMAGNNVHACADASPNNACDTPEPSCSGTGNAATCDFPINLNNAPSSYIPAAIANLFYWNNIIHDVQYQYGFNEVAGNFQENNFGRGGAGSDSVNADAQDGSGTCNANFSTPTDGGNPRMQMFICNNGTPNRDGDLDSGVIVHEYGHGISIRQVGGPSNSSCLNNTQQPGEGWSDWHALVYTAEVGDQGADPRGVGSYLFFLAPDGTIRPQRYSTDPAINNYTYASIAGLSVPHGVGSVWAQAIWEVYWALVNKYGFDPNLYNATGGAGNQRALQYINEGFKNTACSPTFLDTRDGIIQAATTLNGGADVCLLWEAFAAFGLGTDATTGGSNSQSATNGFSIPPSCQAPCSPPPAPTGLTATVPTGINNRVDLSWNPSAGATSYKVFRSTTSGGPYTEIATTTVTSFIDTGVAGGTTYFYVVQAGNSATCFSGNSNQASATPTGSCTTTTLYSNNFEVGSGLADWVRGSFGGNGSVTSWRGIQTCTAASGTDIFRYGGNNCTRNYSNNNFNFAQPSGSSGIFVPAGSIGTTLTFKHRRQYENGFDGGTLAVSLNGTNYFLVAASAITGASYNGTVNAACPPAGSAGIPFFTGSQSSFVSTTVDLDAVCNSITGGSGGCGSQSVRIGFTSITDCSATADGWFLDDVTVTACTP